MAVGHDENEVGLADEIGHQRLAADVADVDAQLRHDLDRVGAGRLAADRTDAGGRDLDVAPATHQIREETLCHRAATNIAGADKKNGSHSGRVEGRQDTTELIYTR